MNAMGGGCFRFGEFVLDPADRRLSRAGKPVELNARYLDALALLVRESGRLVTKDRFLDEVWRGVPVTDEALTQCIRTLRAQLGDSASNPRFIETVPKHGYRFIAPVEAVEEGDGDAGRDASPRAVREDADRARRELFALGAAGTAGGAAAGVIGGLFYGFLGASYAAQPEIGAASVVLVLLCVTTLVAAIGAAGVSVGIAMAGAAAGRFGPLGILGGAAGGLIVGALVKLLGTDAFSLLIGRSPGDITGAAEGAVIGAAVGAGAWLGMGLRSLRRAAAAAALTGGAAGLAISLLGGRMMAGSLDLLARSFPESRLQLGLGGLFGEAGLGPVSQAVAGMLEGMLFAGCVVGAMFIARRDLRRL